MAVVVSMDATLEEKLAQVFREQQTNAQKLKSESITPRLVKLHLLKEWILSNRKAIHEALFEDFRKPSEEADISEIFTTISKIRFVEKNLKRWTKPKRVDASLPLLGTRSYIQYEPKGVCLIIAPWNYPFYLMMAPLVAAIAAGNTAILKPSEMTPKTSALMSRLVRELFNVKDVALFEGGIQTSKALLKLPFDHIFYTGSPVVGKEIMKAAAVNLSSVTLELGGKSPVVVDKSANLKVAAQRIVWGKFLNVGQTCIAPDYLLVNNNIKQKLTDLIIAEIKRMHSKGSEQYKFSHSYGRIVNEKHFKRINDLLEQAISKGANVHYGGDLDKKNRYISPTVLSSITDEMDLSHEEIFGPLLPIIGYNSIDEAVSYINNKPKPLSLYVFSGKNSVTNEILGKTSSGTACINECVIQFAHHNLPFGGVNNSGIGKAHGHAGFMAFTNEKSVLKQMFRVSSTQLLYPPYTNLTKRIVNILIKYF